MVVPPLGWVVPLRIGWMVPTKQGWSGGWEVPLKRKGQICLSGGFRQRTNTNPSRRRFGLLDLLEVHHLHREGSPNAWLL